MSPILERSSHILAICLPIFALIGLGWWLRRSGALSEAAHGFISRFVYAFCLPILIFREVSKQNFEALIQGSVIASTLGAVALLAISFPLIARICRISPSIRAPFAYGSFWSNLSFIGFPLADAAFPNGGLEAAAIVNAFCMPVMVIIGTMLLATDAPGMGNLRDRIKGAIWNPVVMASILGIVTALLLDVSGLRTVEHPALGHATNALMKFMELAGNPGLPLALIAVGASLHGANVRAALGPLLGSVGAKVILMPLLALIIFEIFFPGANAVLRGTAVLLMATPHAVAGYVICRESGCDPTFPAAHLVLSTLISCVTIPIWLYVVLPT